MATYAAEGNRNTAQRIVTAENNFAETLANIYPMPPATALRLGAWYRKNRLAKTDPVMGRCSVKHGALLDPETVAKALTLMLHGERST